MRNAREFRSTILRASLRCLIGAGCGWFCYIAISLIRAFIAYESGGWRAVLDANYPGYVTALIGGAVVAQFWPTPPPRENNTIPELPPDQPVIVTVHGTGAAHAADEGSLWWQRNSPFHQALQKETGAGALIVPFHWSGANSEVSRRAAARELQTWIETLENQGTSYHVIAHSHGGNVAWLALRGALRSRRNLAGLRSWTTVGTPFLRFRISRPELGRLVPLFIASFFFTAPLAYPTIPGIWRQTWLLRPVMSAYKGQWVLPILVLALTAITALLVAGIAADLAFKLLAIVWNSRRAQREFRDYRVVQNRHIAIRSINDEAIAGLAGAVILEESDLAIFPRFPSLNQGAFGKLFSPVLWPMIALYNCTAVPWFNAVLRRKLRDRAHGNPFRLSDVRTVTPTIAGPHDRGQLSADGEVEIARRAATGAADTVVALRTALGGFAVGSDLAVFRGRLAENVSLAGLVHNSYFKCRDVVAAVAEQLRQHFPDPSLAPPAATPNIQAAKIQWPRAFATTALLLLCYCAASFLFVTSIEPNTLAGRIASTNPSGGPPRPSAGIPTPTTETGQPPLGKIGDLMAKADALARDVGLEEARLWYATKCVAGLCNSSGPDVDSKANATDRGSLGYEEFAGLLEAIRWSSACRAANCGRRDQLLATLGRFMDQQSHTLLRREDIEEFQKDRYFLTPSEELYLIVARLAGMRRTPAPSTDAPFTSLPEEKLRSFIASATKEEKAAKESDSNRDLLSGLLYLQPFFDLKLTPAEIADWDRSVTPVARFENKLALASGMQCGYDRRSETRAAGRLRAVRPVERIQAEIGSNYLWWGECANHAGVARTALFAAEADWRAASSDARSALRTARYLVAIDGLRDDLYSIASRDAPADPAVLALSQRVQQDFDKSLSAALQRRDLPELLRLLIERAKSQSVSFDPGGGVPQMGMSIIDLVDWNKPPMAQLVDLLCSARRGGCERPPERTEPRYPALAQKIVDETAVRNEVLPSTDGVMFNFFVARGHMGLRDRYFTAFRTTHAEHALRYMAYIDATSLAFGARELYGRQREPGDGALVLGPSPQEMASVYRSIEKTALVDLSEASTFLDPRAESHVYAALTIGAAADNRFHAAIDYANKIRSKADRLHAICEIIASWQSIREQMGGQRLDELIDEGDATLQKSIDDYISKHPSH